MAKPSRRSMKEALTKRLEGDYQRQKGTSRIFRSNLPDVKFWNSKEGDHLVDIIPYVAGSMDPKAKKGEDSYVLEIFVHRDVGQREGMIICMLETHGKPCPICEERRRLIKKGGDETEIKGLQAGRYPRSIYNVVCYDSHEEVNKGVQVWHTSNFLLQQYLLELAKRPVRPGQHKVEPFIAFMDPDDGRTVAFKHEGKADSTKYIGIKLEERDYKIADEILASAHCLDDLIAWPTYEQVYEDFWGTAYAGEVAKGSEDIADPRAGKFESKKEDAPDEAVKDARPTGRKIGGTRETKEQEQKAESSNPCPSGHKFGVDIDDTKDCHDCAKDKWKDCAREADRIEKEKRA